MDRERGQSENETALVRRARRADRQAIRMLLMRYWSRLRAVVYGIVPNNADTDDILQTVCVRVIEKIDTVREPERFGPWLFTLARREALACRRRPREATFGMECSLPEAICDSPLEALEETEERRRVMDAIRALPEKYRQVLLLQLSGDMTYRDIAETLEIPLTTVQIRLVRARRIVADRILDRQTDKVQP